MELADCLRHLNGKRPQPSLKTGAVIPMRQVRGATMTGASLNEPGCFPFLKALEESPPVHTGLFCLWLSKQKIKGKPKCQV